jgi:hypothetical protein
MATAWARENVAMLEESAAEGQTSVLAGTCIDCYHRPNRPTDKIRVEDKLVQRLRKLGDDVEVPPAESAA